MRVTRRHLLEALCVVAVSQPRSSAAQIPVFDGSRWIAMFWMLKDVEQLTTSIWGALTQVQNAAVGLGGGNLVDDILIGHRNLTADLDAINYSVETITTQFKAVFPTEEAAQNISPSDANELRSGWNREIHQSALAASRAQTALSRIEENSRSAVNILERSKTSVDDSGEGSRLAKLQALVQMLGIINSDLTTLASTIATTERVNASVAAAEVSDEALEDARAERMMRDYGTTAPIPEIQMDLLR